jgi:hypothetical protein
MTLQEILELRLPELSQKRVKLVRHADTSGRYDFKSIRRDKLKLLQYQSEQSKPVFHDCDYIISFLGMESTHSLLIGVFKVKGVSETNNGSVRYFYDLEELDDSKIINDFYDRVVIDWGKATTAWHQWYDNIKQIVEILPQGYIGDFPGYLEFSFDYFDLVRLYKNQSANKNWVNKLSAVKGIYLILDNTSGGQYIGKASGGDGVWGRWKEYATSKHGGNQELIKMVNTNEDCVHAFTYSILQTLPSNITEAEINKYETLYKEKLGSRVHGLNLN